MAELRGRAVTTRALVSRLIRLATGSRVSHVEWVLDEEWHDFFARYGARQAANEFAIQAQLQALPPGDYGTLGAHLEGGIMIRPSHDPAISYELPFLIRLAPEGKQAVMEAATAMIGNRYCRRAILGDLLHCDLHCDLEEPNEADCSEFLAETANKGVRILNTIDGVGLITPRDVILSPVLEF